MKLACDSTKAMAESDPIRQVGPSLARQCGTRDRGLCSQNEEQREYRFLRMPLVQLNVGRTDDLAPFFSIFGNELGKVDRRIHERCAAEIREPRLHFGVG
jgi:hypothetical protein